MLTAEIIAIGTELLTPDKVDTNGLWLTGRLNEAGVEVMLKTIVGDDELRLEEAIRDALKRSDIVISTGGLGPTEDDITRKVAARAVGRRLVYRDELERDLRERFRLWGREMPEINKRQAFIIEDSRILPNPNGSAVGMFVNIGEKKFAILPGPPRENQPMFDRFVFPEILANSNGVLVRKRVLRVTGMGESAVDEVVAPIYRMFPNVQTSILFNKTDVEIHLAARGDSSEGLDTILEDISGRISESLGRSVFTTKGELMEEVIGKLLTGSRKTLSVAESCTGGLIAQRLTDIPGSSDYFIEGVIAYSNEAKTRTLSVPRDVLEQFGAVSSETAKAMAAGMRDRSGTDLAISVTGIAGPGGGSDQKPVGTIFVGFADLSGTKTVGMKLPGDRSLIRWRSSQAALDYLRRQLLDDPEPGPPASNLSK
ncbi:MAG: competence/damage-inducible protein A [Pyrinomonadaceae bacterium]